MASLSTTSNFLAYKWLPIEQFKVTHKFDDPFGMMTESQKWRPVRRVRHWLDRAGAHRRYVGKTAGAATSFRECCRFQLEFLQQRGLQKRDTLLDLGCGSLRAGIHFIDYLNPGNYLGMDISAEVTWLGITMELGLDIFHDRKPEFVISDSFEFDVFSTCPRYAIANSVFTHLPPQQIEDCLSNLRRFVGDQRCELFATFTEVPSGSRHDVVPHYLEGKKGNLGGKGRLDYTRDEMHDLGQRTDWHTEYIGVWGHPKNRRRKRRREQRMFRFASF